MIQGEYLGMRLTIEDVDKENRAFFDYCAQGDFRLQRGRKSGLLRYPPTTACPWSGDREYEWVSVEGRGTVHSYVEVHHAIQPAFKAHVPYMVLLVDLDTQKGEPSEQEALRVAGNLVTPDGTLAPPEVVASVGIGSRVRMVFSAVCDGMALPQWTLDESAPQPEQPWRYPQE
ncbi:MAG: OB-fold domain-containing protein [Gammaproteobacteria bacterium]|nr:OB-fold domain-containing protein [Gammaproteobacteria bacterium]